MNRFLKWVLAFISIIVFSWFLYKQTFLTALQSEQTKIIKELSSSLDCNLLKSECSFVTGDKKLVLSFSGKVKTMLSFDLNANLKNFASDVERISATFVMQSMSMGINSFTLKKHKLTGVDDTIWRTSILLPICVSKRSDWEMTLMIETTEIIYKARIPLQIE